MKYDLVAIGNPVYDVIITPRASSPGRVLSGCSTNACLAAKRLGLEKIALIGNVGRDYHRRFIDYMRRNGIEAVIVAGSSETAGFRLIYDEHGDRTLDVLGIAGPILPRSIPEHCLDSRNLLLGPILGEVATELVEFLRGSTNARILLDPQGLIRSVGPKGRVAYRCDLDELKKILSCVDLIKPNEHEGEVITGSSDPKVATSRLVEWGAPSAIVTLAERGSVIFDGNQHIHVPAYRTSAIDPTGAGDVYIGSFIYGYELTGDLVEAGVLASAAASVMVENIGPDFPLTELEARRRAESIGPLVKVI